MTELSRTKVGRFTLDDAMTLSEIQELKDQDLLEERIFQIEEIFKEYPRVSCLEAGELLLRNGNPLSKDLVPGDVIKEQVRMCDSHGVFIGIYQWKNSRQVYFPVKMFL